MASKDPLVSIVILNWNGLENTKLCLEHVFKLDYSNFEVIVVDNGSGPSDKKYLAKQENIILVDNKENRGFTGGQIDGYKIASGDFILLLNNDAVIKPDYIKQALPLFDDPEVAALGGRSYIWNDSSPLFNEANNFYSYMEVNPHTAETTMLMYDNNMNQEVNSVSGSAVLVRRASIKKVGYLYEPFFAYYEETDLFARFKRSGYKIIYNPKLCIWHRDGATSGSRNGSLFFFYHIFRNRFMFAIRNFEEPYLRKFLKNYYKAWAKSQLGILSNPTQRRLAIAYTKAVIATFLQFFSIWRSRNDLIKKLGASPYVNQIISEQVKVSFIIDATKFKQAALRERIEIATNDIIPLHEYIFVTKNNLAYEDDSSPRVRVVVDKGYFKTHPVNLGVLCARFPWVAIADTEIGYDVLRTHEQIAESLYTKHKVIAKSKSLIIEKIYYQKVGGLHWSKDLINNFLPIAQCALLDNSLSPLSSPISSNAPSLIKRQLNYYNYLVKQRRGSRLKSFMRRHHRLQQLYALTIWGFNPAVPLRLKAGRINAILLSSVSLQRKKLAVELRHIQNEFHIYGKDRSAATLQRKNLKKLKVITKNAMQNYTNIPVFIICYERVDALKKLISWLEKQNIKRIILIDNNSSYKPLLDFYRKTPYQVMRLFRNAGQTAPWDLDIVRCLVPNEYYIVTDPDVIPNENLPKNTLKHFLDVHKNYPTHTKVGFGLKIDDLPDHYPLKQDVMDWEKQFWRAELQPDVYEAGVDTTFAVYKPFSYDYNLYPSLRLGEPYTARHLPWYNNPEVNTKEDIHYKSLADKNITSWNVDELPNRYKEELENQR